MRWTSLCLLLIIAPLPLAHAASGADEYGCHTDKVEGSYRCDTGRYKGMNFPDKTEAVNYFKSLKATRGSTQPKELEVQSPAPFTTGKEKKSKPAGDEASKP